MKFYTMFTFFTLKVTYFWSELNVLHVKELAPLLKFLSGLTPDQYQPANLPNLQCQQKDESCLP